MTMQEVIMHRVVCDGCGRTAQSGDYYAYGDMGQAWDEAYNSNWVGGIDGPKHHCDECRAARFRRIFGRIDDDH